MLALTVLPGKPHSINLEDMPLPPVGDGAVLVRALALGICGTDREIIAGDYGSAPPGEERLILGHESLGRVEETPDGCDLRPGDLVVGIVRRPDPVPCPSCAAGEWDMCRNGRYTERGIKARNGYGSEYFRIEPEFVVKLDPDLGALGVLIEPTSVVAKAWEQCLRIGQRSAAWRPCTALITGAGPIGLLAAMIGVQQGLDVHVYDRNKGGAKPALTRDLGATYHTDFPDLDKLQPDVVMECTGAAPVIARTMGGAAAAGIVCLAGVSGAGHEMTSDIGGFNRAMVLDNQTVFGSVNANHRHYAAAERALDRADPAWLSRLISRRVPLSRWTEAFERRDDDIKVVLDFAAH
ncbi:MAG: glucose 1-dehydrogenase [Proteobacteria bacterium]|nr:glucose 1-dehydrogenase [Pseudomonadota bacterium]